MNNEKKEQTTFKKVLKGIGIAILAIGAGIAIYDHRKQIGSACRSIKNKVFKRTAPAVGNEGVNAKPNTGNYSNNPRRASNNIRRN